MKKLLNSFDQAREFNRLFTLGLDASTKNRYQSRLKRKESKSLNNLDYVVLRRTTYWEEKSELSSLFQSSQIKIQIVERY